ncbi:MAG: M48 family metalloprotease [Pirellulaceae bacterium]
MRTDSTMPASDMSPNEKKQQVQKIFQALLNPIDPVERSGAYKMGVVGASLVLTMMFLAYIFALVVVFWTLLNLIVMVIASFNIGLGFAISLAFSCVIGIALLSVLLAMLKPLFFESQDEFEEIELYPDQEPILFQFVERVCKAVGAPPPVRIAVNPHVNAGASFVSGALDNRMRLIIGLPLVLALDTRQFAGVIAHEFGHFTQDSGMRLTYLVRSLDIWFSQAAFGRDVIDEKVSKMAEQGGLFSVLAFAIKTPVFFAKLFLIILVYIGHFFVSKLMQQMEFDADRHEARLAGTKNFAKTSRRMRMLELSQQKTINDLSHYRRTKQLPDNLPALLVDNEKNIDEAKFRELEEHLLTVKTNWADSHPSDRDRIENVARENTDGTFRIEAPSTILFSDINGLCRMVTKQTYREIFGAEFNAAEIKNTDELLERRSVNRTEGMAALRFVLEQFSGYDTFILPRPRLGQAVDGNEYRTSTEERRRKLLANVRTFAKIRKQEEQVQEDLVATTVARRLIEAGFDVSNIEQLQDARTLQKATVKFSQLRARDDAIKGQLRPFREMMGERLLDSLEFLRSEKMLASLDEPPKTLDDIRLILNVWKIFVDHRASLDSLAFETRVNSLLLTLAGEQIDEQLFRSIDASLGRLVHSMTELQTQTSHLMYPFEHGLGQVSLAHYLVPELPRKTDRAAVVEVADDLQSNLEYLQRRCIARLGSLAEKVEDKFGFDPLETPAEITASSRSNLSSVGTESVG